MPHAPARKGVDYPPLGLKSMLLLEIACKRVGWDLRDVAKAVYPICLGVALGASQQRYALDPHNNYPCFR